MKKQVRLQSENVFKTTTDKVLDTLGNINSTEIQQDVFTGVHHDKLRKLSFQIRDSMYKQLIDEHYLVCKELGELAPDREVMVEEALNLLLERLKADDKELKKAIAHRQRIRRQELESGALINPSSRRKK